MSAKDLFDQLTPAASRSYSSSHAFFRSTNAEAHADETGPTGSVVAVSGAAVLPAARVRS